MGRTMESSQECVREKRRTDRALAAPMAREPKGEREICYAMQAHYSHSRGYKAGFAWLNFKERYGYFTNALLRRLAPIPPDQRRCCGFSRSFGTLRFAPKNRGEPMDNTNTNAGV
jgi:hypothetical protein